jgi:hypothetical protein
MEAGKPNEPSQAKNGGFEIIDPKASAAKRAHRTMRAERAAILRAWKELNIYNLPWAAWDLDELLDWLDQRIAREPSKKKWQIIRRAVDNHLPDHHNPSWVGNETMNDIERELLGVQ